MGLETDKKELRKRAAQRRKIAYDAQPDASQKIASFAPLIAQKFQPTQVAAYWPIRSEIDPIALLSALSGDGVGSSLPITPEEGKPLQFHEWRVGDALVTGPYQTKEPLSTSPLCIPDVILAPLLAFDAQCWRLGYGGGFYDRTIAGLEAAGHNVIVIGIAFDESAVEKVPTGPYDRALSAIVTPSGLKLPQVR